MKHSKLLLKSLAFAGFAFVLLAARMWTDPKNERVAEALVRSAYQTARRGGEQQYIHHRWEAIDSRYGRVLSWHLLGEHRTPLLGDCVFDMEETREWAVTRERWERGRSKNTKTLGGLGSAEAASPVPVRRIVCRSGGCHEPES